MTHAFYRNNSHRYAMPIDCLTMFHPEKFSDIHLDSLKEGQLYSIIHMTDIDFNKFNSEMLMNKFSWQELHRVHATIMTLPPGYPCNPVMYSSAINEIDVAWMTKCKQEHGENWLEEVKKTPAYIFYNNGV